MPCLPGTFTLHRATAIAAAAVLLLAGGAWVRAHATEAVDPPAPMALTRIMRDLGTTMQDVTDGIAREDWAAVAKLAPRIADHPQPALAEKLRILAFIGKDSGSFRAHDQQTHVAALALAEAARRRDGAAAIAAFADVQRACLGCHQRFRQRFQEHFHAPH